MRNLRSPWVPVGLALVSSVLAACTLIVGDLKYRQCASDVDCSVLNTRDGFSATSCPRWFCESASQTCKKGSVDADGDGHYDPSCPGGDDCNDHERLAYPGAMETCNGVDDDCNGIIDDGHLVDRTGVVTTTMAHAATGRYAPGTPGQSVTTWVEGSGMASVLNATLLRGDGMQSARAVVPTTNSHDVSPGGTTDSLLSLTRAGSASTMMGPACMVRTSVGTVACTTDADCLQDHGTCVAGSGTCTGGAPFAAGGSCLTSMIVDAGPGVDGGTMSVQNDELCKRRDVCAAGVCVLKDRTDVAVVQCRFSEAAVDDADGALSILAAIDTQGCAGGALRLFAANADLTVVGEFGPEARSNVFTGVDTTPTMDFDAGPFDGGPDGGVRGAVNRCTGYSRPDGLLGAARPSIAALHGTGTAQALVTYHVRNGSPSGLMACAGSQTVPVAVVAAFAESTGGLSAGTVNTVTASNDGVPQDLGQTRGVAPAGVASLGGAHYAVGFPDATMGDQIAVWVLDPATPPTPFTLMTSPPPFVPRTTMPLTLPAAPVVRITTGATPDAVVLGPGPAATGGGQRIGVAWQEGCDAALGGAIKFAIVEWTPTGTTTVSAPITISGALSSASSPSILYVPDGFVSVGYTRGAATATADTDGGWLVSFQAGATGTPRRTYVTRIAELDGMTLEAPVDVDVAAGAPAVQSAGLYPGSAVTRSRAAFANLDPTAMKITGGTLLCLPGTSSPDGGM